MVSEQLLHLFLKEFGFFQFLFFFDMRRWPPLATVSCFGAIDQLAGGICNFYDPLAFSAFLQTDISLPPFHQVLMALLYPWKTGSQKLYNAELPHFQVFQLYFMTVSQLHDLMCWIIRDLTSLLVSEWPLQLFRFTLMHFHQSIYLSLEILEEEDKGFLKVWSFILKHDLQGHHGRLLSGKFYDI